MVVIPLVAASEKGKAQTRLVLRTRKFQTPSAKSQIISNNQNSNDQNIILDKLNVLNLENWNLEFVWNLEFENWDFLARSARWGL